MYCVSKRATSLASDLPYYTRSKHIDVNHQFIREEINEKVIKLLYVNTKIIPTDFFFTIGLNITKHCFVLNNWGYS